MNPSKARHTAHSAIEDALHCDSSIDAGENIDVAISCFEFIWGDSLNDQDLMALGCLQAAKHNLEYDVDVAIELLKRAQRNIHR